jgi:hypothetical protein
MTKPTLYVAGPAPCDNCPQAPHCRAQLLACVAFRRYVDGEHESSWRAVGRAPSAELYLNLMVQRRGPAGLFAPGAR